MELKIYNPQEGALQFIEWNFEDLKAELIERSQEYKTIVYTSDEQIKKEAREDRAKLRKLSDALDNERKRIKKLYMEPVDTFEKQVKELTRIIGEAVDNIDGQIKAYEERQREEKLEKIHEIYDETVPELMRDFVTFDVAMIDKYLLKSTSLKAVREGMKALADRVKSDMEVISNLPDYVFEATEKYKQTLDLQWAMRTVNDLRDAAERKRIFEEQQKAREIAYREQQAREAEALANANRGFVQADVIQSGKIQAEDPSPAIREEKSEISAPVYSVGLNIRGTKSELDAFCQFLNENHIHYEVTKKPQREE